MPHCACPFLFSLLFLKIVTSGKPFLRESVGRLRQFPFSGHVVPELGKEEIREVLRGDYRLIYRVSGGRIDILAVFHCARILDDRYL
ncbi:MAG TPA: type II toxin-antitoxin system RelE/ParE family toxin [Pirellula sp.]|nr:type II toxin-antitoxin system RelE/ParE family toxin [Pirellula sp.]